MNNYKIFTNEHCSKCKMVVPRLIEALEYYMGKKDYEVLDPVENPELIKEYNLKAMPTVITPEGKLLDTVVAIDLETRRIYEEE